MTITAVAAKASAPETTSAPAPRVRARNRPAPASQPEVSAADVAPPATSNTTLVPTVIAEVEVLVEASNLTPEEAKTKAIADVQEFLRLKDIAAKAKSAETKAERALAKFVKQHKVANFAIKLGETIYDVGEMSAVAEEVDPVKLFAEIGPKDAIGLCKISREAVTNFGGKPLLDKVLSTVTKEPEFKVRKRT